MKGGLRGVLLDLDGTLIDSLGVLRRTWDALLREQGVTEATYEFEHVCSDPLPRTLERLAAALGADVAQLTARHSALLEVEVGSVAPVPGASRMLETIRAMNLRSAIVTNATAEYVHNALHAAGLDPIVDTVVSAVEHGVSKHDPELYEIAGRAIGLPLEAVLHVDDDPEATEAASLAGVGSVSPVDRVAAEPLADASLQLWSEYFRQRLRLRDVPIAMRRSSRWVTPPSGVENRVEARWSEATARDRGLFDGEATILIGFDERGLEVASVPYRYVFAWMAGDLEALGGPDVAPLGVTAVVLNGSKLLVAERRGSVRGGSAEFLPAGTLPPDMWADPVSLITQELAEEVPGMWEVRPVPLGLHRDPVGGVWDLVFLISADRPPPLPRSGPEHRRIAWVDAFSPLPSSWAALQPEGPLASFVSAQGERGPD